MARKRLYSGGVVAKLPKSKFAKSSNRSFGEADVEGVRGDDEPEHNRQATDDDDHCELFWANLPVEVSRERHILNIPKRPERCYPGRAVKSREVMLG